MHSGSRGHEGHEDWDLAESGPDPLRKGGQILGAVDYLAIEDGNPPTPVTTQ